MLSYLVTSAARRRLLTLLFGQRKAKGTAGALAKQARISLSHAQAELELMRRRGWLVAKREGNKEVFAADTSHSETELLEQLVAESTYPKLIVRRTDVGDDEMHVEGWLRTLGAPLSTPPQPIQGRSIATVLLSGVGYSRRNPVVARVLPVVISKVRDQLEAEDLRRLSGRSDDKHGLAFMLELTGELGRDRRLIGLAETLRDRRRTATRPFFEDSDRFVPFPLARKWGFDMSTDRTAFETQFRKFVKT